MQQKTSLINFNGDGSIKVKLHYTSSNKEDGDISHDEDDSFIFLLFKRNEIK